MLLGQLFSQRIGYAVHALCYMAQTGGRNSLTTVPELAQWMRQTWPDCSETYLANVVRRLVRGGLLISQRGISGGYALARSPQEITLCDVVTVLEGVSFARCALTPSGRCDHQDECAANQRMKDLQRRYAELLAEVTIDQLAGEMAVEYGNGRVTAAESAVRL